MRISMISSVVGLACTLAVLSAVPTPAQSAEDACVTLRKKINGREVLINTCQTCQVVKVERQRGGGALPSFRTFVVQPKSTFDLPFKGPGRTRVAGAKPCS